MNEWNLPFVSGPLPGAALATTHDLSLVVLSYLVAALAAYTAIELAGRVKEFRTDTRQAAAWLAGGAFAMGAGIWAMHFVGMLAYQLPIPVRYETWRTLASMLVAVATSGFALYIVTRATLTWQHLLVSGVVMGLGIAAMHYTGMAAMRLNAMLLYQPWPWLLSILNAVVCSTVALWLVFRVGAHGTRFKLLAALVMGVAIAGMHYTGMLATVCVANSETSIASPQKGLNPAPLAELIALVTALIMGTALTVSLQSQLSSRRLREQNEQLRDEVDQRRKAEAHMQLLTQELQSQAQVLEVKNVALESARQTLEYKADQLTQISKYKSEFLSNMSHELRTPLNAIVVLSTLLAENKTGNLTDKQTQYAKAVHESGNDLLSLINEILDLAKIESGTMALELTDVVLSELLAYCDRSFRHLAEQKNLGFQLSLEASLPAVIRSDGRRLQQVLKNLLANAFKFTSAGEVALSLRLARSGWDSEHEKLNQATAVLAFDVRDSGIGIEAQHMGLIFEAFRQVDVGDTRKYGGTGLGLSISREIAQMLGGTLQVSSVHGQGSCFTLYLPLNLSVSATDQ